MLQEAIEYIVGLKNRKEVVMVEDRKWIDTDLTEVKDPLATQLCISTLTGLVDYIRSNFDGQEKCLVHVVSPTEVELLGLLNKQQNRNKFVCAEAIIPNFSYDSFYDTETLNIKLQSMFLTTLDRDIILQAIGNISEENVKNTGDDGISQVVEIRQGIKKNDVLVPNPVTLTPIRTFSEVEQPSSQFVFRMKDGPFGAVFEADGKSWRNEAILNIANYLKAELVKEMEAGQVHIIA
ncbi:hypothetical protein ACV9TN_001959 [Listeria monocytogenes]|uniref:Uncharacterized protein n=1 Tax=Listeria monocytogenes TaxID=1639 RepID=A0A5L5QW03_LISMN|nr:hypothetical protein [Listeria monocytogenes]EAE2482733.1 hypothetical protein [Listeria innocua]EAA0051963.1 hypothetical protein [Listeria monocytogenes]EAA0148964.1 hypothetical protein [Listeria monocytogenes]EAA0308821.1 hypothetical protein [Listeria monocytogenes]EAA0315001.1 hypothetical protein [Listeria monocytogenes]